MSQASLETISGAVEAYIQGLMLRGRSTTYILRARNYLDQMAEHLGPDYPTRRVRFEDWQRFARAKKMAFTTAHGVKDLLNACLTYAAKNGVDGDLAWFRSHPPEGEI